MVKVRLHSSRIVPGCTLRGTFLKLSERIYKVDQNSTNVCNFVWPSLTVSLILPIIIYSSGPIHLFAFLNKVLGRIQKKEIFSEWPTFKSCSFTLKKRENYFSIFTLMTMISSKNELNYNRIDFKLITLGISVYWDELTVS